MPFVVIPAPSHGACGRGCARAPLVFGPFAETKGPRRAGPKTQQAPCFSLVRHPRPDRGSQCCYLSFRKPIASRARQMAVYGPINGYLSGDYITFPCIPDIYQKSTTKALTTYSYLFTISTVLLTLWKSIDRIRGATMRSSTGRWVNGSDFFDRERELQILETHVRDHNHLLLTGQRRMGKTSILRELGRRLEGAGWVFLFTDVEGATCAEDAIAAIAQAVHPVRSISSRFATGMKRWGRRQYRRSQRVRFWRQDPCRPGCRKLAASRGATAPRLRTSTITPCFWSSTNCRYSSSECFAARNGAQRVDEFLSFGCAVGASSPRRRLPGSHRIRQHRA